MKLATRKARARRDLLRRVAIWIFLVVFALSVAGTLVVFIQH